MKIRNRDALLSVGDTASRSLVLDIAEDALSAVDGYRRVRSLLSLDGAILHVGNRQWDLSGIRHVYLIGAGKACNAMAMAVEDALGEHLTRGIAIVKIAEESDRFERTEVHVGGHPYPNAAGHAASRRVLEMVDEAGPEDLFLVVISGGSSALMNMPVDGISVEDEAQATEVLLTSGAGIYQVNAVRRHISQTNGGRLAERIAARGAQLIGIGISDAVGKPATTDIAEPDPDYASTPIGPDRTTLDDARAAIRDLDLTERMPRSIVEFLDRATDEHETPKAFPQNTYFVINTLPDLAHAAAEAARRRGVEAHVLTTFLEGESRDAGTFMAAIAREAQQNGRPFTTPCVVVSGGETVTTIAAGAMITGHGGPSQELTVGFALAAGEVRGGCMYAMDSEGTDGTSPAAGGLTDSTSLARAADHGIDLRAALRGHATFEALSIIGDAVMTGNTGTNLCDLNILYIPAL